MYLTQFSSVGCDDTNHVQKAHKFTEYLTIKQQKNKF